ncbi:DUF4232 domain-containing protein [Serinicoccus profundi]|uniref:DUF4232 domain-containing protein n=3 Tax=Serinicoccus profundi TaxID=1078471 RepID=UPI001315AB99|nr:DUF4232 domain-containing protein [Serinicoccus profundi]
MSVVAECVTAALVVVLLWPVAARVQSLALVRDLDLLLLVVSGSAAVAGLAAAWLHVRLAGRVRGAGVVGGAAAVVAGTAFSGSTLSVVAGWTPLWLVSAATLASTVAAVRLPPGRRVAPAAGSVLGTVLLCVAAAQTVAQLLPAAPGASPPLLADEPEGTPEPPAVDAPGPTIGDLCHPDELILETSVPEPAMSDVVATLTLTNEGERTCRVEGFPTVSLIGQVEQDDLTLQVRVSEVDPAGGGPVEIEPVEIAPGDRALTQVWWPSWGAAADLASPQQLRIGVGGSTEVLDLPPERRWDVVQSAEAWVGPWRPVEEG